MKRRRRERNQTDFMSRIRRWHTGQMLLWAAARLTGHQVSPELREKWEAYRW